MCETFLKASSLKQKLEVKYIFNLMKWFQKHEFDIYLFFLHIHKIHKIHKIHGY